MVECKYCGKEFKNSYGRATHQGMKHPDKEQQEIFPKDKPTGKDNGMYNKEHSEEWKNNQSKRLKEYWKDKEHPTKNSKLTEDTKEKIGQKSKQFWENGIFSDRDFSGNNNPNWQGGKVKIQCEVCGKPFKVVPSVVDERKTCSKECSGKQRWRILSEQEKEKRIEKIHNGQQRKPTSIEEQFIEICNSYDLPYKYVGDGDFWIENMNPDFIEVNGKKIAIEILGDYWHNQDEFQKRKEKFSEYGWECIGIWGHELKKLSGQKIVENLTRSEE